MLVHHRRLLLPLLSICLASLQLAFASSSSQLHNRAIYTPHVKRLATDVPSLNPNVTFVNAYSRPHTTGLTDLVAWDRYSFYVKGQRLLIYGGEVRRPRSRPLSRATSAPEW